LCARTGKKGSGEKGAVVVSSLKGGKKGEEKERQRPANFAAEERNIEQGGRGGKKNKGNELHSLFFSEKKKEGVTTTQLTPALGEGKTPDVGNTGKEGNRV